ncbi:MAG: response regulator [Bacteroidetes bacterium]|nr:response regulator [Bacteroidota bacterium]
MEKINLFIVADNALVANGLKHYLNQKFSNINVFNFYDSRSCLKHINKETQVVILDHVIHGKSGIDTLRSIKTINPDTEVIMHTSGEDVVNFLNGYYKGDTGFLVQKAN